MTINQLIQQRHDDHRVVTPEPPRRRRRPVRQRVQRIALHVVLIIISATCLLPFLWMISTSFKQRGDVFTMPPQFWPSHPTARAYQVVTHDVPALLWALNSIGVAGAIAISQVVFATLAAYAFAKLPFRGRGALFGLFLATMMVPSQVTIIPLYILMKYFGWVDTYFALAVPFMFVSGFGTFLVRQFFLMMPSELEDAALIDGAGHLRIMWTIAIPLARPVLLTFGVFSFMFFWNDLLWPLIVTNSPDHMTLPVGLANLAVGIYGTDWPTLMAGSVIAIVPIIIVFLAAQKYFVQGISLTGLK